MPNCSASDGLCLEGTVLPGVCASDLSQWQEVGMGGLEAESSGERKHIECSSPSLCLKKKDRLIDS